MAKAAAPTRAISGAEIVVDALIQEKVEVVFGYPGGAVLDIFDRINQSEHFEFILVRHEQAAGHMADGYARSSGKVGVAIVTSGPGATNAVTPLATAYMDSVPMVVISGQVPTAAIGNDAFQEADVVGVTRPITKHNFLVKDVNEIGAVMKKAFHIARTGRPGPVLVDIPKDVQRNKAEDYKYPSSIEMRSYRPHTPEKPAGDPKMIKRAARAIEKSERPILYVGQGAVCADAQEELIELAERCQIPVTTTLLGLGAFPEDHKHALRMLGMHGTEFANLAMHETDCIIAVGARFDDRVTGDLARFAPQREEVIHIDIDPSSISKVIQATVPIVADCKKALKAILKEVKPAEHKPWLDRVLGLKNDRPLKYGGDEKLRPQYVIDRLFKMTGGDAIVVTDVGQHQMWAAHYWHFTKPRTFLSSGGLGTMGFGFPAAIGAQFANPEKLVVNISGDGGIQMNIQELATVAIHKVPVKVIILNNMYLGMVRQWQHHFYDKNYSGVYLGTVDQKGKHVYVPDFVKLLDAYGLKGMRVDKRKDVDGALEEMIKTPGCVFVDFRVEEQEDVWPMIPAGKSVEEMISGLV